MEFNIASLSGTLTSANLKMDLFSSSGPGVLTVTFDIFAYGADGVASLADFNGGAAAASSGYNPDEAPFGLYPLALNTSVLQGIIDGGATHLGIRVQDNDGQEVGTHEASFFRPHTWPEPLPVLDLVFA